MPRLKPVASSRTQHPGRDHDPAPRERRQRLPEPLRDRQRPAEEVLSLAGHPIAAPGAAAWNPAFDMTPAGLVDYLVTEAGVIAAPDREKLSALYAERAVTEKAG